MSQNVDSVSVRDSDALLAHFEDHGGGEHVRKILRAGRAGKTKLSLSVITLGEIYYNTLGERGRNKVDEVKCITEPLPISTSLPMRTVP